MYRRFGNRYGIDIMSMMLILFALPFLVNKYFIILGLIILAYVVYRALSTNFVARQNELNKFNRVMYNISIKLNKFFQPIKEFFRVLYLKHKNRNIYKYVKCKKCKKTLRLPVNKGSLKVTCPDCKDTFTTKT